MTLSKEVNATNHSIHYESDILFFFDGNLSALALYQTLFQMLDAAFPEASVKVQKSQISFYGKGLFAMVSLTRRKRDPGIVVSFGLGRRELSPRISTAVEPYPGRWTHHIAVTGAEELDEELLGWLREAWAFSQAKGQSGTKTGR